MKFLLEKLRVWVFISVREDVYETLLRTMPWTGEIKHLLNVVW